MKRKLNRMALRADRAADEDHFFGKNLNFAATEAYKLLRTNLSFCLHSGENKKCSVVGTTSSVQGEGKSTTSINLAYMLAEDGKRVCLVEGDMRAPTFVSRLNLKNTAGLSHVLAGMKTVPDVTNMTGLQENLSVISVGEIPPNPAELLGSERMTQLIYLLREMYDFVIIDLPPITVVADALAVSSVLDGIIVVVEDGVCTRRELSDAMQRLDVIRDKILGFVVTRADTGKGRYGKKKYGKYGYGHESGK